MLVLNDYVQMVILGTTSCADRIKYGILNWSFNCVGFNYCKQILFNIIYLVCYYAHSNTCKWCKKIQMCVNWYLIELEPFKTTD